MHLRILATCLLVTAVHAASPTCDKSHGIDLQRLDVCRKFRSPSMGGIPRRVAEDGNKQSIYYDHHTTFGGHIMFSLEYKVGYMMVPKGGSSSLRFVMARDFAVPWKMHHGSARGTTLYGQMSVNRLREWGDEAFTFSFVANPMSHVIGGYIQTCGKRCSVDFFRKFVNQLAIPDSNTWGGCPVCDVHHLPQMNYFNKAVSDSGDLINFDFVGRLTREHAGGDFSHLKTLVNEHRMKFNKGNITVGEIPVLRQGTKASLKREINAMLKREPIVVRQICYLRFSDYSCLGFDFPKVCLDEHGQFNVTEYGPPAIN